MKRAFHEMGGLCSKRLSGGVFKGKYEESFCKRSPEINLILSCLKHAVGKNRGGKLELRIPSTIDWNHFIALVEKHRVSALVYKSLKTSGGDKIPASVIFHLKRRNEHITRRTLMKSAELGHIQKGLRQKQVRSLSLKGPVVSLLAFGDLGSRHVGDLDLLVSDKDLHRADQFLHQLGYIRRRPHYILTTWQQTFFKRNNSHFEYFCPEKRIQVELHYRCGPYSSIFPLRFEDAWTKRQTVPIGGVNIDTFCAEHTLMALCVHGAVHGWSRLFWLADLAKLTANGPSVDWAALIDHSNQMGIFRMVAQGLTLGAGLLDAPLPEKVIQYAFRDKTVSDLVKIAWDRIQSLDDYPTIPRSPAYFRKKRYELNLRSDFTYKWDFFLYQIGPAYDEWEVRRLPNYMFSLYFFMKPVSLFNRWRIHHKMDRKPRMLESRITATH